jgi:hypothetical protein
VGETVRETRWEAEVTHHRHAVHRQPVGGGVERQRVAAGDGHEHLHAAAGVVLASPSEL